MPKLPLTSRSELARRARRSSSALLCAVCVAAISIACTGLGLSSTPSGVDAGNEPIAEVSAEAIAAVERMSAFIASRSSLGFTAEIQYDAIQSSGQKLEFGSERRIILRRPSRARVSVTHWDGAEELMVFDGKRLSVALPEQRIYASVAFEGTASQAFDHLVDEHNVASPLFDLLSADLPKHVKSRTISALDLGTVTIGGVRSDHYAFHGERVDFQIFIRQGDEPVPLRFVIDYHAEPGSPQFRAQLRDWELDASPPDSLFRFAPVTGAQRVPFAELLDLLLGPEDPELVEEDL